MPLLLPLFLSIRVLRVDSRLNLILPLLLPLLIANCQLLIAAFLLPVAYNLAFHPIHSMTSERVDGSGSSHNFTAVRGTARDKVFLSSPHRDPLPANDQRVAALHHQNVFVVVMDMLGRRRILSAGPECHLTSISSIEHVALNSRSSLTGGGNLVGRMFHEFRKVIHMAHPLSQNQLFAYSSIR